MDLNNPPMAVRVSTKAIIIRDGKILLTRNRDEFGDWYIFPGGGQEHGETLVDAVRRECREEIGTDVEVGKLLYVRDYIASSHDTTHIDRNVHQIELMFECKVPAEYVPTSGAIPDSYQVGVEGIPLAELSKYRTYPNIMPTMFTEDGSPSAAQPTYLGDVQ